MTKSFVSYNSKQIEIVLKYITNNYNILLPVTKIILNIQ